MPSPHLAKKPSNKLTTMPHKKFYITLGILVVVLLAAVVPPLVMPSVSGGVDISSEAADTLLLDVHTHFDNPIERIAVLKYQITDKYQWRESDVYTVVGRTVFGIKFNRADAYMDGGLFTIPSLENDVILQEAE